MISFRSLFSGSSGNSYFFNADNKKFLVDAGVSAKRIREQLEKTGESIDNINGIFITHEHSDHLKGLNVLIKNKDIPVYINEKTYNEYLRQYGDKANLREDFIYLFDKKEFEIDELTVKPFGISHDAVDPVGFSFFDKENKKLTIATDLGIIDDEILDNLSNSDMLLIESNYDDELIAYSSYPYYTIQRIRSDVGHLSNEIAADAVCKLIKNGLKEISLGHISKMNNEINLIKETFEKKFLKNEIDKKEINLKILDSEKFSDEIIIK